MYLLAVEGEGGAPTEGEVVYLIPRGKLSHYITVPALSLFLLYSQASYFLPWLLLALHSFGTYMYFHISLSCCSFGPLT